MPNPNVSALVVRRIYRVDRRTLFEAFAEADQLKYWFFPWPDGSAEASNEFKVGGTYQVVMHSPEGKEYPHTGEYREIVPDRRIVFTWNSRAIQDALVTVEFHEVAGGTELVLTHEFLPNEESRREHEQGWQGCLENLSRMAEPAQQEVSGVRD